MRVGRKVEKIDIHDFHAEIEVVPIGALILWDEINEKRIRMDRLLRKMESDAEKYKRVSPTEYTEFMDLVMLDIEKQILQILSLILDHEANDSHFDRSWWLEHIDQAKDLINRCIQKDITTPPRKNQRKIDWDMLYSMVNKYWRAMSWKEFFDLDFKELGNIVKFFPKDSQDLFLSPDESIRVSHMRTK